MGSQTDYPWFFRKIIRPSGLQALQALGRLPWPATSEADSRKATQPHLLLPRMTNRVADFKKPAKKDADSKKPAETTTTKATPT